VRRIHTILAAGAFAMVAAILAPIGTTNARWADDAELPAQFDGITINVGQLNLNQNPDVEWVIVDGSNAEVARGEGAVPGTQRILAGQTLRASAPITPQLAGTNMSATFEVFCNAPTIPDILSGQGASFAVYLNETQLTCDGDYAAHEVSLTTSVDNRIYLTFNIPQNANLPSTEEGFVGEATGTVNLGDFSATLTQVSPFTQVSG